MKIENISEFTIYEVEKLQPLFLEKLKENGDLLVDMSYVKKIDMAGIQLLLAFIKSATHLGKKVKFQNLDSDVAIQIKICKYDALLGISND